MTTNTPYMTLRYPDDSDNVNAMHTQIQNMAEDFDAYFGDEGTWTPTVTQNGTLTFTFTRNHYKQRGRWVEFEFLATYSSGTGTGATKVTVSTPVNSRANGLIPVGAGWLFDSSASTRYNGVWFIDSGVNNKLVLMLAGGLAGAATMTAVVTTNDQIYGEGEYEV